MKPRKLRQKLTLLGWDLTRTKGSHFIYKKSGQTLSVPERNGKDVSLNILRLIARVNSLTLNQLRELK